MENLFRQVPAILILIAAGSTAQTAHAALGGDYQSVQSDSVAIRAQVRSTETTQYTVHELSSGTASTVREYVSPSGQVFAVTWQGFGMPDLRQLLGTYFDQYSAAAKAQSRPGQHRHLLVSQSDLVVQSFGRMRDFHGRAYVPSLVPDGVSVNELP
jgi:hypothetical protein